ncbi:MAG: 50S ribosomal protein L32e [Candidatus Woesearchaeota archaeon]
MADLNQVKERRKRKPLFVRKDSHKKARVASNWRKPRGKHSPIRQQHKGKPKLVSVGYGSPEEVKGLHLSGLKMVLVDNAKQLESLDPKTDGVLISGKIGNKKRIDLIKLASEKKLKIINIRDVQKKLEALENEFKQRVESKKKKLTEKDKKEADKKKKAEEKEKEKVQKTEETAETTEEQKEKKEQQKEEVEKTIIKKQ